MSLTPENILLFNRLAGSVVFTNAQLRQPDSIARNRLGQPGLWPHSISGDLPIVLARVAAARDESLVRQLLQWHAYTRRRGLELDLVILDQRADEAAERLRAELQTDVAAEILGKPGGIFLLDAANVPADDAVLLAAAARVVLGGGSGVFRSRENRASGRGAAAASIVSPLASSSVFRTACQAVRWVELLERCRRIHSRWSRVRDRGRRHRPWGTGFATSPVDQRARQS